MRDTASCPECDADVRIRAGAEGGKLRCKECGTTFGGKRKGKKPERKSRTVLMVAIGLGGFAVLLVTAGIAGYFVLRGKKSGDRFSKVSSTDPIPGQGTINPWNRDAGLGTLLAPASTSVVVDAKGFPNRAVHSPSVVVIFSTAPYTCDAFDTGTGRRLGGFKLGEMQPPHGMSLSPDGTRLAIAEVTEPKDENAISIWSVPDGEALVTRWTPYPPNRVIDPRYAEQKLIWFSFLSADRLLTVTQGGRVALWSLPDCKAIYDERPCTPPTTQGFLVDTSKEPSNFALSADRGTLALQQDDGVTLVSTATGRSVGTLPAPAGLGRRQQRDGMAFSPDGQRLAASYTSVRTGKITQDREIVVWELASKRISLNARLPETIAEGKSLVWWGGGHLVSINYFGAPTLISADSGAVLRQCLPPEPETKFVNGSSDGKLRYIAGSVPARRYLVYDAPGEALSADGGADDGGGHYKRYWLTSAGIEKRPIDSLAYLGKVKIPPR